MRYRRVFLLVLEEMIGALCCLREAGLKTECIYPSWATSKANIQFQPCVDQCEPQTALKIYLIHVICSSASLRLVSWTSNIPTVWMFGIYICTTHLHEERGLWLTRLFNGIATAPLKRLWRIKDQPVIRSFGLGGRLAGTPVKRLQTCSGAEAFQLWVIIPREDTVTTSPLSPSDGLSLQRLLLAF